VLAATGSVLTNKYSEGYPGKRYYGVTRSSTGPKTSPDGGRGELFGPNTPTFSPTRAPMPNLAAYLAVLEPGDTVLGMRLDQGGHLTHGSPVNASGRLFNFVSYGVSESDERIDFEALADLPRAPPQDDRGRATAYSRVIEPEPLRKIADSVGALLLFRRRPHRRVGGRGCPSQPRAVLGHCHLYDP